MPQVKDDVDGTRIIAGAIALAVNLFALYYLSLPVSSTYLDAHDSAENMQVVFIRHSTSVPLVTMETRSVPRQEPHHRLRASSRRAPNTTANHVQPSRSWQGAWPPPDQDSQAVSPANDRWQAPVNRSLPDTPSFQRNPIARTPRAMEAAITRTHFRMQDSSMAGRWQATTKASICGDLRRALATSPASASAILSSMETHGCGQRASR